MSISWKASLPISADGTLPVIATIGTESSIAVPMPGDEVRGARAGGAHADADRAGDARVAVGRVGAALLVADEDVAQLGVVAQDVVQRQDHAARVAEEDVDALAQERLAQDVGADARALEVARLVEHALLGALDRGGMRRAVAPARDCVGRVPAGPGGFAGSVFIVMAGPSYVIGQTKDPRLPARVPSVMRGSWRLASVPPRPSVLPPGAGNEPKKAIKPQKRAKKREERYVGERVRLDGHMDAATVRRHHDGDHPAILPIELAQAGLQHAASARSAPCGSRSLAGFDGASTSPRWSCRASVVWDTT